jgi:MFS family permease
MLGGTVFALVGCIVAALAPNVPALIAGTVLIGLGGSCQYQFSIVTNELVPMKYRYYLAGSINLFVYPITGWLPAISNAFVLHTPHGWRT